MVSSLFTKPVKYGFVASIVSLVAYSVSAIISMPKLGPVQALNYMLLTNGYVMVALPILAGVQVYLITYSKTLPCSVRARRSSAAGAVSGSAASAFFSFFPLANLACCGTWLPIVTAISGAVGVTTGSLIDYSGMLSAVSIAVMLFSIVYTLRFVLVAKKTMMVQQLSPTETINSN